MKKINNNEIVKELLIYNNIYEKAIKENDFLSFFNIKNVENKNVIDIVDYEGLYFYLNSIFLDIKEQIKNKNKKDKKTRSFGIFSLYIYILTYLNLNIENITNNIMDRKKVSSYEFNKTKRIFIEKGIFKNYNNSIYLIDLFDIFFFFQYNNGFLNSYILNLFKENGIDIYDIYGIKVENEKNNKLKNLLFENNMLGNNYNNTKSFYKFNSYNIIFLDYYDIEKSDFNEIIRKITYFYENNKNDLFYNNLFLGINSLTKDEKEDIIKRIKKQILIDKKYNKKYGIESHKFNNLISYLPKRVKKIILRGIILNLDKIEKYLEKEGIKLFNDLDKKKYYTDILYKMLNLFNIIINNNELNIRRN